MKQVIIALLILLIFLNCKRKEEDYVSRSVNDIISTLQNPLIPERSLDLIDFSKHQPDEEGDYDFKNDIQLALDSLAAQGGGKLVFRHPDAKSWIKQIVTYRIKGFIELRSNIELSLDPNIRLFFEFSPKDYLKNGKGVLGRYEGTLLYSYSPLIRAFNCTNIAIRFRGGNGAMPVIDGDGQKWQKWSHEGDLKIKAADKIPTYISLREANENDVPVAERIFIDPEKDFLRPRLMEFILCKNVLIENIKLVNSPFWVIHPVFSENLIFRGLKYDAQVVNNDGIDVESSRNVLIENIIFDNHDDNVVIKSGINREGREGALIKGTELDAVKSDFIKNGRITAPTENVVVRNCVFKGHYAFCVGSDFSGSARNIFVIDNIAPQDVMMGIFIKSSRKRGGTVENVHVRNLKIERCLNEAICINPNYDGDSTGSYPSLIKNITIEDVQVKNSGKGIMIFGWADKPIEDVELRDINIHNGFIEDSLLMQIEQAKNVQLKNVFIQNKIFKGKYTKQNKSSKPPKRG